MGFSWIDVVLGILLTVGLLYIFYLIDRKYVYKKEQLGFLQHIMTTAFFPKRLVAYLSVFGVTLAFFNGPRQSLVPGTLSYDIVEFIYRISAYPFIGLVMLSVVSVLKIIFFPERMIGPLSAPKTR